MANNVIMYIRSAEASSKVLDHLLLLVSKDEFTINTKCVTLQKYNKSI